MDYEQIMNFFGEQRDLTEDEALNYYAYLERISQPTVFDIYNI